MEFIVVTFLFEEGHSPSNMKGTGPTPRLVQNITISSSIGIDQLVKDSEISEIFSSFRKRIIATQAMKIVTVTEENIRADLLPNFWTNAMEREAPNDLMRPRKMEINTGSPIFILERKVIAKKVRL